MLLTFLLSVILSVTGQQDFDRLGERIDSLLTAGERDVEVVFEPGEASVTCDFCGNKLIRKEFTSTAKTKEGLRERGLKMVRLAGFSSGGGNSSPSQLPEEA